MPSSYDQAPKPNVKKAAAALGAVVIAALGANKGADLLGIPDAPDPIVAQYSDYEQANKFLEGNKADRPKPANNEVFMKMDGTYIKDLSREIAADGHYDDVKDVLSEQTGEAVNPGEVVVLPTELLDQNNVRPNEPATEYYGIPFVEAAPPQSDQQQ